MTTPPIPRPTNRHQPTYRHPVKESMRLIRGANSVELKLTVPSIAHRSTVQGLPDGSRRGQPRQIFFFDTPDLQLNRAGVVFRARRIAAARATRWSSSVR